MKNIKKYTKKAIVSGNSTIAVGQSIGQTLTPFVLQFYQKEMEL